MGGVFILLAFAISALLWIPWGSLYLFPVLFVTIGYGIIGFVDDLTKLRHRTAQGILGRWKLMAQMGIALLAVLYLIEITPDALRYVVTMPSFKDILIPLGVFYVPFALIVIVGASNAVNLTDGLDGLAIGSVIICAASFALIAYLVGNAVFADYLQLHYVPGTGELAVICGGAHWRRVGVFVA